MGTHFVDQPSPQPSPLQGEGASLAVLQFVALMRGEWRVQAPRSPFRVVRVEAEHRYCLGCFGERVHDVICGSDRVIAVCRCCGKEGVG